MFVIRRRGAAGNKVFRVARAVLAHDLTGIVNAAGYRDDANARDHTGEIDQGRAALAPQKSGTLTEMTNHLTRRVDPRGEGFPRTGDVQIDEISFRQHESMRRVIAVEIGSNNLTHRVNCTGQGLLATSGKGKVNVGEAAVGIILSGGGATAPSASRRSRSAAA